MHVPRVVSVTRDCARPTLPSGNSSRQSTVPAPASALCPGEHPPRLLAFRAAHSCHRPLECVGPSRQVARVAQELELFGTGGLDLNALDHQTYAWSSPFTQPQWPFITLGRRGGTRCDGPGPSARGEARVARSVRVSSINFARPRQADTGTARERSLDRDDRPISAGPASKFVQSSEVFVRLSCDVRGRLSWFRSTVRRTLFDPKGEVCPPPDSYRDRCSPTCPHRLNQS